MGIIQENNLKLKKFEITASPNLLAYISKEVRKVYYYPNRLEQKQKNNIIFKKSISGFVCKSKKHKNPVTGDLTAFLTALLHSISLA